MKEVFKITSKVLINALLVFIAYYLLKLLLLPAIICTAIVAFFKRNLGSGFLNISEYFKDVAVSIDQVGNVICSDLLNLTLRKKGGINFGNLDETISSVLGKNKRKGTLSKVGKILDAILDKIDPNHSINAIEEDE